MPKILFLCTASPFGTSGSGVRTLHLARLLARIGDLRLAVGTERPWSAEQLERTRAEFQLADYFAYEESPVRGPLERYRQIFDPRFLNTNGVRVPPAAVPRLDRLLAENDVVWIHTQKLANCFRRFHWPKSIIDVDDYPSRFHASALPHAKWILPKLRRYRSAFAWRRREAIWRDRFSVLTVCKEADCAHFGGGDRVHVVPNGFALPEDTPSRGSGNPLPRLGMIGDFTYLPNHDGLRWFLAECWPQIRRHHPAAELRLIGKNSADLARALGATGVQGLGYLPDTSAEINSWAAMIVPTRLGGGTHLKVAEGLARRVPIVTTRHGSRGYDLENGRHAMVADTPADFSDACALLLQEPDRGRSLAAAGFALFETRYSWDAIQPAVERAVTACLHRG